MTISALKYLFVPAVIGVSLFLNRKVISETFFNKDLVGTVASDVKKVKASALFSFSEGYAVVHNGTDEGMIDPSGAFFIPYGKYHYDETGYVFGMCGVYEQYNYKKYIKGKKGFVNKNGELAVPYRYSHAAFLSPNLGFGRKPEPEDSNPLHLIDNKGKELGVDLTKRPHPKWDEGKLRPGFAVTGHGENRKGQFTDYHGNVQIPAVFFKAHNFKEGLAAVKSGKDYYHCKWGFIDENGKMVVPFIYDHEPGDFASGLARIILKVYKRGSETVTQYGYIDKKGKLVSELTNQSAGCYDTYDIDWSWADFNSGYVLYPESDRCGIYAGTMDSDGNKYAFKQVDIPFSFQGRNLRFRFWEENYDEYFGLRDFMSYKPISLSGGGIPVIWRYDTAKLIFKKVLLSPDGKKLLIPPVFDELGDFDPESGLAYAKYSDEKGLVTEGYVDLSGVFQIIKI